MAKGRSSSAKAKKVASPPLHPKYEDMVQDAIVTLKERKGSSRQAIKKYILTTYKLPDIGITSSRLRLAINKGVDKGIFSFPNGPSGTIKLVKKEQVKKAKKEAEKKEKPKKDEKKEVKPKTVKVIKTVTRKAPTGKAVTSTSTKKAPAKPKKTSTATMKTRSSTANTASEKRTGTRKKEASS